jgi:hypothetical protein
VQTLDCEEDRAAPGPVGGVRVMPRIGRWILVLTIGCVVAIGLVACGSSRGNTVVQIGTTSITRTEVDHWMSIVAAGESTPPGQPKADTPEPPSYTKCIAYLEHYPMSPAYPRPRPARAQLKLHCEQEYRKEKLKALYILISRDWVAGAASALGVRLADAEVMHALASLKHQQFPSAATFERYLASMRYTVFDIASLLKLSLLESKVQHKLEARADVQHLSVEQRQRALDTFSKEYEQQWIGRTDCHAGYVVPICRQYKRPKTPPTLVPPSVPLTHLTAE